MTIIDQVQFIANLRITQAYCERELQHKEKADWVILRSMLNPFCKEGKWFVHMPSHDSVETSEQPIPIEVWAQKTDPYYVESFVELFNKQLEFKATIFNKLNYTGTYRGKILVIDYGMNIPDGAAEPETGGFFDEWDMPPIDTWFYNNSSLPNTGLLFAWIPEKFVGLAEIAIDTQFLGVLQWFEKPPAWDNRV